TGAYLFPIGDSTNYTPVTQTWSTNAGATGDVTACVTAGDHPNLNVLTTPTTGIDATHNVNRWWSLTNNLGGTGSSTTPSGVYGLSFTYVNTGTGVDNDSGTTPANYIVERYVSASGAWFPTTISGTPTTTSASTSNGAIPAVQTSG